MIDLYGFWLFITGRGIRMAELEMASQRFGFGTEEIWKARRRMKEQQLEFYMAMVEFYMAMAEAERKK